MEGGKTREESVEGGKPGSQSQAAKAHRQSMWPPKPRPRQDKTRQDKTRQDRKILLIHHPLRRGRARHSRTQSQLPPASSLEPLLHETKPWIRHGYTGGKHGRHTGGTRELALALAADLLEVKQSMAVQVTLGKLALVHRAVVEYVLALPVRQILFELPLVHVPVRKDELPLHPPPPRARARVCGSRWVTSGGWSAAALGMQARGRGGAFHVVEAAPCALIP